MQEPENNTPLKKELDAGKTASGCLLWAGFAFDIFGFLIMPNSGTKIAYLIAAALIFPYTTKFFVKKNFCNGKASTIQAFQFVGSIFSIIFFSFALSFLNPKTPKIPEPTVTPKTSEIVETVNKEVNRTEERSELKDTTAGNIMKYFVEHDAPNLGGYFEYDEETDINHLLGRPNQYTSKVGFSFTNVDNIDEFCATIEAFENEADAQERYNFIENSFEIDPTTKQYLYLNGCVIMRMKFDVLPADEQAYERLLDEYLVSLEEDSEESTESPTETETETVNEKIDVQIEYECETVNGKTVVTLHTNLPDETVLMLTLSGDTFAHGTAQDKVTIKDGVGISSGFSNQGEPLKGHFSLKVSMSIAKLQSDAVKAIIGLEGEALTGKYVEESSFGGKVVSATFELDLPTEADTEAETTVPETIPPTQPPTEAELIVDYNFISNHENEIVAVAKMALDRFISDYEMSLAPQLWKITVFDDSGAIMAKTDMTYNGINGEYIYVGTLNISNSGKIESAKPHYIYAMGTVLGDDGYCNDFFETINGIINAYNN